MWVPTLVSVPQQVCDFEGLMFGRLRPNLGDFGRVWRELGQSWPELGHHCAISAEFGPTTAKLWPGLAKFWRHRSSLARFRNLVKLELKFGDFSRILQTVVSIRKKIEQSQPRLAQIRMTWKIGSQRPTLAQIRPALIGPAWPNKSCSTKIPALFSGPPHVSADHCGLVSK